MGTIVHSKRKAGTFPVLKNHSYLGELIKQSELKSNMMSCFIIYDKVEIIPKTVKANLHLDDIIHTETISK